jgi:hypothetical protein
MNKVEANIKVNKMIKHLKDMNALKIAITTPNTATEIESTQTERNTTARR